ncbi:MAG: ribosomal protein S18-alanine N-acetyltransferase [Desulfovibrio sp.]|nr:ribosomal protein S18-alanine N-acetyltransferase [Desulfovibrio sp.]
MARVEKACFSLPWTEPQIASAFTQKAYGAFGLFSENLLGYISVYHVVPEMEILNLAVLPAYRRKGYGRFLLMTCLQASQKMGIHTVWLEVRERNVAARALYDSVGFVVSGVRAKYYSDTGEDACILVFSMT